MSLPENPPPRLTDQLAAELRARAAQFGLTLTSKCQWCGRPIWAHQSIKDRTGPVCRRRHQADDQKEAA
ncbi:hypothetical protein GCM10009823_10390 [Brevibacterium salitolerans]|uniref:Uncharacterized protein n=1 Tax=Brevibacterium salitolerans TaxID=1403566 RepID=A0ABN2WHG7_9MICO